MAPACESSSELRFFGSPGLLVADGVMEEESGTLDVGVVEELVSLEDERELLEDEREELDVEEDDEDRDVDEVDEEVGDDDEVNDEDNEDLGVVEVAITPASVALVREEYELSMEPLDDPSPNPPAAALLKRLLDAERRFDLPPSYVLKVAYNVVEGSPSSSYAVDSGCTATVYGSPSASVMRMIRGRESASSL